ncbi:hypothetical protein N7454_009358 [Penicillium verhagenii]|nr:hypothetical protein N7454_009358 [Penicillium verhagenii]
MSSRFPPSSGYNSRDRSPHRFGDRRPPAGPRGPDDGSAPFGREPPSGPRALRALGDTPRGNHFGRGRGYGRGEFRDRDRDPRDRDRDREFRDSRDAPPFRRDLDREWVRRDRDFDPRDNRIGFGRGRSRSPTRDFRDVREPPGRDFDLVRIRRNSRDSILSASSGGPDGPPSNSGHPRGGSMRGRGRGDWDGGRGRGRPSFFDDREQFRRRSRSRDTWRDRGRDRMMDRDRERDRDMDRDRPPLDRPLPDRPPMDRPLMDRPPMDRPPMDRPLTDRPPLDRPIMDHPLLDRALPDRPTPDRNRGLDRDRERDLIRDRDHDRNLDRRERFDRREEWDARRSEREDRDRPLEPWKREHPPNRADNRAGSIAHVGPSPMAPSISERMFDLIPQDQGRKASIISSVGGHEARRDSARSDLFPVRTEPLKDSQPANQQSPPPSAPQVPAFGSVAAPTSSVSTSKGASEGRTANDPPAQAEKPQNEPPSKPVPRAPTGPKAERAYSMAQAADNSNQNSDSRPPQEIQRAFMQLSDRSPPTGPAAMAKRDSVSGPTEFQGPSKPHSISTSPTTSRLPPPPRSLSRDPSISPQMQTSNIPTGPRAFQPRQGSSPRGGHKGNKPWGRSGYNRAPSVSTVTPKKEAEEQEPMRPPSERSQDESLQASSGPMEDVQKEATVTVPSTHISSPTSPSMNLAIRSSPPPAPMVRSTHQEGNQKSRDREEHKYRELKLQTAERPEQKPEPKPEEQPEQQREKKVENKPEQFVEQADEQKAGHEPEQKPEQKLEQHYEKIAEQVVKQKREQKLEEKSEKQPEEQPDEQPEEQPVEKPEEQPVEQPENRLEQRLAELPDLKAEQNVDADPKHHQQQEAQAVQETQLQLAPEKITEDALMPVFGQSSDEDDEDSGTFSEEYLEKRKRSFERDMELLRAELPPSPLEDPHILSLLMRIQLLGKIAQGETADLAAPEPLASSKRQLSLSLRL